MKRRVAILISGRGSNMAALIDAAKAEQDFPAEVALVISNVANAPGLTVAAQAGIAAKAIPSKPFGADRAGFETHLQAALDDAQIDLICLCGFMRLFTPDFVRRWDGRMLNVHPSLLPAFKGLDPHGQALRAGVKLAGATVHFVTPDTDSGPIVAQGAVPVADGDTPETLAARVLAVEHRLYPAALRLVASGAVAIEGEACHIAGRSPDDAMLLSVG